MQFDVICLAMEGSKIISGGVHSDFGYIGKIAQLQSQQRRTVPPQPHLAWIQKPSDTTAASTEIWLLCTTELAIEGHQTRRMKKEIRRNFLKPQAPPSMSPTHQRKFGFFLLEQK